MVYDDGGWNSPAIKKRSRWALSGWIALALLIGSISLIGILKPARLPKPDLDPGEQVSIFDTEIFVQRDGSLLFTENMRTMLEGKTPRHGVTRRLPTVYLDSAKNERTITYSEQQASVAPIGSGPSFGQPIPVSSFGDEKSFTTYRIGDQAATLNPGSYDFLFRYTAQGLVHSLNEDKQAGFFWNVTGGIVHPISSAEVRVKLPQFTDVQSVSYGAFLGIVVDRSSASRATKLDSVSPDVEVNLNHSLDERDVIVTFRPLRPMQSFEHFIVKVTWPAGLVETAR